MAQAFNLHILCSIFDDVRCIIPFINSPFEWISTESFCIQNIVYTSKIFTISSNYSSISSNSVASAVILRNSCVAKNKNEKFNWAVQKNSAASLCAIFLPGNSRLKCNSRGRIASYIDAANDFNHLYASYRRYNLIYFYYPIKLCYAFVLSWFELISHLNSYGIWRQFNHNLTNWIIVKTD